MPYLLLLPRSSQNAQQSTATAPQIHGAANITGDVSKLPSGELVTTRMAGEVTENDTEDR